MHGLSQVIDPQHCLLQVALRADNVSAALRVMKLMWRWLAERQASIGAVAQWHL